MDHQSAKWMYKRRLRKGIRIKYSVEGCVEKADKKVRGNSEKTEDLFGDER